MERNIAGRIAVAIVLATLLLASSSEPWNSSPERESTIPDNLILQESGVVQIDSVGSHGAIVYAGEGGVIHAPALDHSGRDVLNWTVTEDRITVLSGIPGRSIILWGDSSGKVGTLDPVTNEQKAVQAHHGSITAIEPLPRTDTEGEDLKGDSKGINQSTGENDLDGEGQIPTPNFEFAVASEDSTITIMESTNLTKVRTLTDNGAPIFDLTLSQDGRYLAAGGLGREVLVYDTDSWSVHQRKPVSSGSWVTALTWRPSEPDQTGSGEEEQNETLGIALSSRRIEWFQLDSSDHSSTTNLSSWANDLWWLEDENVLIAAGMDGNLTIINSEDPEKRKVIEGEHPVMSICKGSGDYDLAAADTNGTLRFLMIEDAVPVESEKPIQPEPVPDDPIQDADYEDSGMDGELLLGLIILIPIVIIIVIVSYVGWVKEMPKYQIPVARAVSPPPKRAPVTVKGSTDRKKKEESKVINIFIKDSVINRSNLLLDEEMEEDAKKGEGNRNEAEEFENMRSIDHQDDEAGSELHTYQNAEGEDDGYHV